MANFTPELIEKARKAKTAEELQALAKESGWEMTDEEAAAYFAQLHPVTGEMADDELENVSGGACYKDDRMVTTVLNYCELWTCKKCGQGCYGKYTTHYCSKGFIPTGETTEVFCYDCKDLSYEKGLWLCNHPQKCK